MGLLFLRTSLGIALIAGLTTLLVALAGGSRRPKGVHAAARQPT